MVNEIRQSGPHPKVSRLKEESLLLQCPHLFQQTLHQETTSPKLRQSKRSQYLSRCKVCSTQSAPPESEIFIFISFSKTNEISFNTDPLLIPYYDLKYHITL